MNTERPGYHDAPIWATWSTADRCRVVSQTRHQIAVAVDELVAGCRSEQRTDDAETVASELIPLCDALRWIGKRGAATLKTRRVGWSGRPVWMWGVRSVVQRVPLGRVLILGTWNYPLLLPGVQIAQALAAGNQVLLKPAPGTESVSAQMVAAFHRAGVPPDALTQLDSSADAAINAMNDGVDLVVLTGAASTGRKVMQQTAQTLTPSIMELSGVDAAIVLAGADPQRVADAIAFGLLFNSGATCIGPRRLMIESSQLDGGFLDRLLPKLRDAAEVVIHPAARQGVADLIDDALRSGAKDWGDRTDTARLRATGHMAPVVLFGVPQDHAILRSDVFAPVISVIPIRDGDEAVGLVNGCPYRLAASVFGKTAQATQIAGRLNVGVVTVNDLVAPTADPRLPFGGRGESGFGLTRGPEGLLAMSTCRVISTRRGRIAPHLSPRNDADAELLTGVLQVSHGRTWGGRIAAIRRVTTAVSRWRALQK